METKEKITIDFFSTSTNDYLKDLEHAAEKNDPKKKRNRQRCI